MCLPCRIYTYRIRISACVERLRRCWYNGEKHELDQKNSDCRGRVAARIPLDTGFFGPGSRDMERRGCGKCVNPAFYLGLCLKRII